MYQSPSMLTHSYIPYMGLSTSLYDNYLSDAVRPKYLEML